MNIDISKLPGIEPDANVMGFWRSAAGSPHLTPDFILVANLVRDHRPSEPVLFRVAFSALPERLARGDTAVAMFKSIVVSNGTVKAPPAPQSLAA